MKQTQNDISPNLSEFFWNQPANVFLKKEQIKSFYTGSDSGSKRLSFQNKLRYNNSPIIICLVREH